MKSDPDFRLFCLALRRPLGLADPDAFGTAITAAAPDWHAIIAGAHRHRVAPLLLAGLQSNGGANVPDHVIAELHRQASLAARRSLVQVAEIGRLAGAFAQTGVRMLALKGVTLAAQLHGGAFARGARDIDLLVDPADLAAADAVLAAAGYRRREPTQTERQRNAYRHAIKDLQYVHAVAGPPVELHHRLADNPNLLAIDFATLWRERATVSVGDAAVPTLARHRLALYLTVHGAGHGWERLLWLIDLAAALKQADAVEAALAPASAAGLGDCMLHAVMLAHDWLGVPVPHRILASARESAKVARLDRILAHLYAGTAWSGMPPRSSWQGLARYSVWQRLYRVSLKSDWRYVTSQMAREWFTPADWDTVRLPDRLHFLYPAIRPVGWLARRWRTAAQARPESQPDGAPRR